MPPAAVSLLAAEMTVAPLALVPGSSPTATLVPGLGGIVCFTDLALLQRQMNLTRLSFLFHTTFRSRASVPCHQHE